MELKIRIKSPLLTIRNGLIVESHSTFSQDKDEETAEYGIKRIANNNACVISPYSILGWLRHGITEYLISQGISPCHSFDIGEISSASRKIFAVEDLKHGYHMKRLNKGENKEKPECLSVKGKECIVSEIFGGFTGHHRVFSLMPIKTSPIDSQYTRGVKNITGKGNYRSLAISPRSIVDGTPYQTHSADMLANIDAILNIKMYEPNTRLKPHVALIMRGIDYLYQHKDDFKHQLGGSRTFGCGFIEPTFLSPELTREETTKYHSALIKMEDKADDLDTLSNAIKDKITKWENDKKEYEKIIDDEIKIQRELFGVDKKWWSQNL